MFYLRSGGGMVVFIIAYPTVMLTHPRPTHFHQCMLDNNKCRHQIEIPHSCNIRESYLNLKLLPHC